MSDAGTNAGGAKTGGRRGFGTKIGFIMAAAGSAVGLGNLIRFPYITGEYGGGAFVLVYIAAVLLVGLPLMFSELILGQQGKSGIMGAIRNLTSHCGIASTIMSISTGLLAVITCCMFLAFYSVLGGWTLHYLFGSIGFPGVEIALSKEAFEGFQKNLQLNIVWHSVFMLLTTLVVAGGVQNGIERLCNLLMPMLILFLIGLLGYVAYEGWLNQAVSFLFTPDFSRLSPKAFLDALGQAFFSLSIGMGTMVIYGSYMKQRGTVVRDGVAVSFVDTGIALLGGMVIFSILFSAGQKPDQGLGLLFVTLPNLFAELPAGSVLSIFFFALVVFAAWSSSISLLEVPVSFLIEEFNLSRRLAAALFGLAIWGLGMGCAVSLDFLNQLDSIVSLYLLPLGGMLVAIIVGWMVKADPRDQGFTGRDSGASPLSRCWLFTLRFISPVLIVLILLYKFELLDWLLASSK